MILLHFLQATVYALVVFGFLYLAKKLADKRVSKYYNADFEIEVAENLAVALRRAGLYIAIGIGMVAVVGSENEVMRFLDSLVLQLFDGVLLVSFLFIAMKINDKLILPIVCNDEAIAKNNIAVGLVEFGSFIATGLIAYASFYGQGPWYSSVVFFVLGQGVLLAMVLVYEARTSFKIVEEIRDNNIPAGLMVAGILVAYSLILKASILGPFTGWVEDIFAFALSALSGMLLLALIANKLIENIFLPNTNIEKEIVQDRDIPPILVVVAIKITLALIIGAVVL